MAQPERQRLTRDEQRKQTVGRLLDSAEQLFSRDGIAETSIEDIAENAGYSRGVFYSNFDDKDALVLQLIQRQQDWAIDETNAIVDTETDPEKLVERLLDWSRDPQGKHATLGIEYVLYASRSEAGRPRMKELSDRLLAQHTHLVASHYDLLETEMPISPQEAGKIMHGLDEGFALLRLNDPENFPQSLWGDTIAFLNEAVLVLAEKRARDRPQER